MILISSWSRLCPILWSQVLSREWRCSWSSADRRCSNYIWVIDNLITYWGAYYIRDLTVVFPINCAYGFVVLCFIFFFSTVILRYHSLCLRIDLLPDLMCDFKLVGRFNLLKILLKILAPQSASQFHLFDMLKLSTKWFSICYYINF